MILERNKSLFPGIILIMIGGFLLIRRLGWFYIGWYETYPIGMLLIAFGLFYAVFRRKEHSSIFPATILLVLGGFFFLRNFDYFSFDYYFYDGRDYWPVFPLAVGVAFIVQSFVGPGGLEKLIPGVVLFGIGGFFFLKHFRFLYWLDIFEFWPLILVLVGAVLIIDSLRKKSTGHETTEAEE